MKPENPKAARQTHRPTVEIKQAVLPGNQSPQLIAVAYLLAQEYRVYAPPGVSGRALNCAVDWFVREPKGSYEVTADDGPAARVKGAVELELAKQLQPQARKKRPS